MHHLAHRAAVASAQLTQRTQVAVLQLEALRGILFRLQAQTVEAMRQIVRSLAAPRRAVARRVLRAGPRAIQRLGHRLRPCVRSRVRRRRGMPQRRREPVWQLQPRCRTRAERNPRQVIVRSAVLRLFERAHESCEAAPGLVEWRDMLCMRHRGIFQEKAFEVARLALRGRGPEHDVAPHGLCVEKLSDLVFPNPTHTPRHACQGRRAYARGWLLKIATAIRLSLIHI